MKKAIILTALILDAGSAYAQDDDTLAMLDTDVDGRISVEEAASDPGLSALFAELDVNKDGYLTPSELAGH